MSEALPNSVTASPVHGRTDAICVTITERCSGHAKAASLSWKCIAQSLERQKHARHLSMTAAADSCRVPFQGPTRPLWGQMY